MQVPVITKATLAAFGRHVVSYSMGAVTVAAALHVVSNEQAGSLGTAIGQIVSGLQTAMGGIATVVSIAAGLYAAWTATPTSQAKSLVQTVPGTSIVTDPSIASATPQTAITSNAINKVVSK